MSGLMISFLYDYIYTVYVTLTALLFYCGHAGMEKVTLKAYALALLPTVLLSLLTHLRLKERLMLIGITLAGMTGILIVYSVSSGSLSFPYNPRTLPLLFISLASFAAGFITARSTIARISASAAVVLFITLTLEGIIHPLPTGIFPAMGIILTSVCDEIQIRWKKEGFTDNKAHLVFTMPFISAILITASLIHYPADPYDWKPFLRLRDGFLSVIDRIEYRIAPASDAITGFSENGTLMTGLTSSSTEALRISASTDLNSPLYLSGRICDRFDGHSWKKNDRSDIPERTFDVLESISSVKLYSDKLRDYYTDVSINVEYTNTKSHYLFAPSKLTAKDSSSEKSGITEDGGDLVFTGFNPYHLSIKESYLNPNSDHPGFYSYMQSETLPEEDQWKEALSVMKINDKNGALSYKKYPDYRAFIKKTYSEYIPISGELAKRLSGLYEGADSEYEKMKRLEASMQEMKYNLDPAPIPDEVDSPSAYLDYFLLSGNGGYCSYYATAFVLLARAEGLPARYVQGYRIPAHNKETCIVTSGMAHAWPEVYFEGKGWIAFEPTPGFYTESVWSMSSEITAPSFSPKPLPSAPPATPSSGNAEALKRADSKSHNSALIIIPSILIIVFFILFVLINRLLQRHRLRALNAMERQIFLSKDCLNILKLLGCGLTEGETLSEYRSRISSAVMPEALAFISDYENVLYSKPGSFVTDTEKIYKCRRLLLKVLKEQNRLRYIIKILFP